MNDRLQNIKGIARIDLFPEEDKTAEWEIRVVTPELSFWQKLRGINPKSVAYTAWFRKNEDGSWREEVAVKYGPPWQINDKHKISYDELGFTTAVKTIPHLVITYHESYTYSSRTETWFYNTDAEAEQVFLDLRDKLSNHNFMYMHNSIAQK